MNKNTEELIKRTRKPNQTDTVSLLLMSILVDSIELSIDCDNSHLLNQGQRDSIVAKRHSAIKRAISNLKHNQYDTKRYVR